MTQDQENKCRELIQAYPVDALTPADHPFGASLARIGISFDRMITMTTMLTIHLSEILDAKIAEKEARILAKGIIRERMMPLHTLLYGMIFTYSPIPVFLADVFHDKKVEMFEGIGWALAKEVEIH